MEPSSVVIVADYCEMKLGPTVVEHGGSSLASMVTFLHGERHGPAVDW